MQVEALLPLMPYVALLVASLWMVFQLFHGLRVLRLHLHLLRHDARYLQLWKAAQAEEAAGDDYGVATGKRIAYFTDRQRDHGLLTEQEHARAQHELRGLYGAA